MRVCSQILVYFFITSFFFPPAWAQDKVEDFRASNRRVALISFFNEFIEPSVEEELLKEARRQINRYAITLGPSEITQLKLLSNPNNQYLRPSDGPMAETQAEFLKQAAEDNRIDIFMLALVREAFEGIEMELQLYDQAINTKSAVERSTFVLKERQSAVSELVYRVMNYIDRDGFVHPEPQDFLQKPVQLQNQDSQQDLGFGASDAFFVTPEELGGARLAGEVAIGGEKTPFWERWWFWTLIFGGLGVAGGLSYYFLVVDQPPSRADVEFFLPAPPQ